MAHILVVDDMPEIRAMFRRVFVRCGHRVTEAASASEVLIMTQDPAPDLVLMDLMLPTGEAGETAIRYCRAAWPEVPIVAISGMLPKTADLGQAAETLGVTSVVRKDGDWRGVVALVDRLLASTG